MSQPIAVWPLSCRSRYNALSPREAGDLTGTRSHPVVFLCRQSETHMSTRRELSPSITALCTRTAVAGCILLFAYLTLALHGLWPASFRLLYWVPVVTCFAIACVSLFRYWPGAAAVVPIRLVTRIALSTWSVLITFLAADVLYGIYYNRSVAPTLGNVANKTRAEISSLDFNAALPQLNRHNITYYKPGFSCSATVFGDLCTSRDLASQTIRDKVCEFRAYDVDIDSFGFRGFIPRANARMILLGDSFAFGANIRSSQTYAAIINRAGYQCYNMGKPGTGLIEQYRYLATAVDEGTFPGPIDWIIWSVFEGNDLEDSRDLDAPAAVSMILDGTLPGVAINVLETIRDNSILNRIVTGEMYVMSSDSHREADGIHLRGALYRSDKLGLKLFYPPFITHTQQSADYVLDHPNRPRIERAFADMRELATALNARVLVLLTPSAPRVHGQQFEGFPELDGNHFMELVKKLAGSNKFDLVDLYPVMQQKAGEELFYFRDDTHFNQHGHSLAADEIIAHLERHQGQ